MVKKNNVYAFKIFFLCCCLSGAVAGIVIHCKGIFYAPVSKDLGVSATKFATYSTFGSLAGVVLLPLVTKLFNTKPLKKILIIYLAIFCGADVLMGFVTKMWQCYLIGIVQGSVSSFLTVYPIAYLLRNWFTKKRGFVTGIATMFSGIFSSIMNIVLNLCIQSIGWRLTYILIGISAFFLSAIPVCLFAVRNPSDIGLEPYGGYINSDVTKENKTRDRKGRNKALFCSMIPMMVLTFSFYMATGYNQHLSNYAILLGKTATFGASLISICMIGNTVSKIVLGYLNDKLGVYGTSMITVVSMAFALIVLMFEPSQAWLLYSSSFFLGQSTAFIVVQIPLLLSSQYSNQTEYETCLSTVMMIGSLTGAVNSFVINFFHGINNTYRLGHGVASAMLIVCACMIILLKRRTSNKMHV